MKLLTEDENKERIKVETADSTTTKPLNGYVKKGKSVSSASVNNRQSSSDNTKQGNCAGRDTNNRNRAISGPISGNCLENRMSFSSVTDVNKELFNVTTYSKTLSNEGPIPKQACFKKEGSAVNGMTSDISHANIVGNQQQPSCDQNSNNRASVLSDISTFASSSLKSFSSHIDSTLRGSKYLENVRQHQHNYQQKQDQTPIQHCHQQARVQVWYCVQFRRLCQLCLAMPLLGLVGCLIVACIFQFADIQETACKVGKQ